MADVRRDIQEVLISETQIQQRLDVLAADIERDYADKDLTLVAVLTGSVMFVADLLRRLPGPLRLDYVGVSSYHGGTTPNGDLIVTKALQLDVAGRDVLIVDDILDTGHTLVQVRELVRRLQPQSVRACVFLEKQIPHWQNMTADYVGFKIPDRFVVGYGLDYQERYRNLPCVATLKPSVLAAIPASPPAA